MKQVNNLYLGRGHEVNRCISAALSFPFFTFHVINKHKLL